MEESFAELFNAWLMQRRQLAKAKGLTFNQRQFAEKCGLGVSHITRLKKGERKPREETIKKLAHGLGLSYDEFMAGPPSYIPNAIRIESDIFPVFRRIPRGDWRIWARQYPVGKGFSVMAKLFNVEGEYAFAVEMQDDTMEPMFHPGDMLVIDPTVPFLANGGGVGLVALGEDYEVRHIYKRENVYTLIPENRAYEPETVPFDADIRIYSILSRIDRSKDWK